MAILGNIMTKFGKILVNYNFGQGQFSKHILRVPSHFVLSEVSKTAFSGTGTIFLHKINLSNLLYPKF